MSTSKGQKNTCMTCKTAAVFTCNGCSKVFCLRHTTKHRQALDNQMSDIINSHNHLQDDMMNGKLKKHRRILMEQIDHWETQSIEKIHQAAKDIRQQLETITRQNSDNNNENLTQLTQQLTKARDNGNFFENDLKQWTKRLQKLQYDLTKQQNITIDHIASRNPFISKISLAERIDYGIKQLSYESSRTQSNYSRRNLDIEGEYSSGHHVLRFQFDQYQSTSRMLIGIISKNTSITAVDPPENPTFYGWGKHNLVYLHGIVYPNYRNYQHNIETDDIFQLILDCNQQVIRLKNERTNDTYEIIVDIAKCPFPWRPYICLLNNFR